MTIRVQQGRLISPFFIDDSIEYSLGDFQDKDFDMADGETLFYLDYV